MLKTAFTYRHRVIYADCTLGDHVYYARFLEILEAARGEFLRTLRTSFLELQRRDCIFPVIECRLLYKAMARYDDLLAVEVRIKEAEGVRLTFSHQVTNQNALLILQAETCHVCTSIAGKPRRLPPELGASRGVARATATRYSNADRH